jgi:hypothetical protein
VRRSGWFVAGMATAVGVVAAGEMARRRLHEPVDELPPAVGYEQAMAPNPPPASEQEQVEAAEPEAEPAYMTVTPLRVPAPDRRSDELRTQIAESRRRLHEKARAGADEESEAVAGGGDDEEPTEEH